VPDDRIPGAQSAYRLLAAQPNPFNPQTVIRFELDVPGQVELAVFDQRGHRIAILTEGHYHAGGHSAKWDGRDSAGRSAASGTYFVRLRVDDSFVESRTMTLLK
jgi:flagellar hook assembly protein FlgD